MSNQYALCMHGPDHAQCGCGYAHRVRDLSFPKLFRMCQLTDQSQRRGGPAGIDIFVGQLYSPVQWLRIQGYLQAEAQCQEPFPLWVSICSSGSRIAVLGVSMPLQEISSTRRMLLRSVYEIT